MLQNKNPSTYREKLSHYEKEMPSDNVSNVKIQTFSQKKIVI